MEKIVKDQQVFNEQKIKQLSSQLKRKSFASVNTQKSKMTEQDYNQAIEQELFEARREV